MGATVEKEELSLDDSEEKLLAPYEFSPELQAISFDKAFLEELQIGSNGPVHILASARNFLFGIPAIDYLPIVQLKGDASGVWDVSVEGLNATSLGLEEDSLEFSWEEQQPLSLPLEAKLEELGNSCPDCPENAEEGEIHLATDGVNYIYEKGIWTKVEETVLVATEEDNSFPDLINFVSPYEKVLERRLAELEKETNKLAEKEKERQEIADLLKDAKQEIKALKKQLADLEELKESSKLEEELSRQEAKQTELKGKAQAKKGEIKDLKKRESDLKGVVSILKDANERVYSLLEALWKVDPSTFNALNELQLTEELSIKIYIYLSFNQYLETDDVVDRGRTLRNIAGGTTLLSNLKPEKDLRPKNAEAPNFLVLESMSYPVMIKPEVYIKEQGQGLTDLFPILAKSGIINFGALDISFISEGNNLGIVIYLPDGAGLATLANEVGNVIYALTRPDVNAQEGALPYEDRPSEQYSFAYEKYILQKKKGKDVRMPQPQEFYINSVSNKK